jgi:hypothetical protein
MRRLFLAIFLGIPFLLGAIGCCTARAGYGHCDPPRHHDIKVTAGCSVSQESCEQARVSKKNKDSVLWTAPPGNTLGVWIARSQWSGQQPFVKLTCDQDNHCYFPRRGNQIFAEIDGRYEIRDKVNGDYFEYNLECPNRQTSDPHIIIVP